MALQLLLLLSLNLKVACAPSPSQPIGKADGITGAQEDSEQRVRGIQGHVGGAQGPFEVGAGGKGWWGWEQAWAGCDAGSHQYLLFASTLKQATTEMTSSEVGQVPQSGGDFMGGNPCQSSGMTLWNRTRGPGLAQGLGCMGPDAEVGRPFPEIWGAQPGTKIALLQCEDRGSSPR